MINGEKGHTRAAYICTQPEAETCFPRLPSYPSRIELIHPVAIVRNVSPTVRTVTGSATGPPLHEAVLVGMRIALTNRLSRMFRINSVVSTEE